MHAVPTGSSETWHGKMGSSWCTEVWHLHISKCSRAQEVADPVTSLKECFTDSQTTSKLKEEKNRKIRNYEPTIVEWMELIEHWTSQLQSQHQSLLCNHDQKYQYKTYIQHVKTSKAAANNLNLTRNNLIIPTILKLIYYDTDKNTICSSITGFRCGKYSLFAVTKAKETSFNYHHPLVLG